MSRRVVEHEEATQKCRRRTTAGVDGACDKTRNATGTAKNPGTGSQLTRTLAKMLQAMVRRKGATASTASHASDRSDRLDRSVLSIGRMRVPYSARDKGDATGSDAANV